jgi:hypothetical protein
MSFAAIAYLGFLAGGGQCLAFAAAAAGGRVASAGNAKGAA